MDIPILKIEDFLIISFQNELSDHDLEELRENVLEHIKKTNAKGLVIDITALGIVDSFMARTLSSISDMAALLGTKTVIVGIQPAVALTLVELGLRIKWKLLTALNLEKGINLLRKSIESEKEIAHD
ncbi:MAG: STAS domain-containing protein [Candidatus Methanoperedenaceae archaeon]|nr:STAS domain-containing protein [Candidatus Methanoperedenaceae archaeon]